MHAATTPPDEPSEQQPRTSPRYRDIPKRRLVWLLLKDTVNSCIEYRILGLAAEAAFFTLLSLPPLLLGLIGLLGYLDVWIGTDTIASVRENILEASATVLSERSVNEIAEPLIDDVIRGGRPDLISFGFVLALWSGSRAVNVFIDTITVMYGLDGHRGIVKTRLLAFLLYVIALLMGAVALPLMVIGPDVVISWVPQLEWVVSVFYWPVVLLLSIVFLTTLFHVSVPVRSPWREDVPGALVALLMWVGGSFLLRLYLTNTVEGPTIYGSLAAPVAILLWIFISAFAVLVGAAVNAAIDRVWPSVATAAARRATERQKEAEAAEMVAAAKARREQEERDRREAAAEDAEDGEDDGEDDDWGSTRWQGEEPPEFPERWARFLPPDDVRGRFKGPHKD
ncbi:YihY/virulence factor BrkB family protein [Streptomyces alkaliterrae]|uniref:YihY/virulence factor BrkB family protein n=1 Tax=Streptomyces alkaliterrae TaxID=2213162 RepID=UPI00389B1D2D